VFLRTDTHWTPYGARVAAGAAAPAVAAELQRAGSPRAAFLSEPEKPREHRGDLLRFIRLGPRLRRLGPPADSIVPVAARAAGGGEPGLFGELVIPVVLVGTSYSAGPLWGFEDALKMALQADVLNVAEEGRGPFLPMRDLLEGTVLEDVGADLVIWEIPERYFNFPP
jgi:alginate O-acetyltransferase complex protein AlgJ